MKSIATISDIYSNGSLGKERNLYGGEGGESDVKRKGREGSRSSLSYSNSNTAGQMNDPKLVTLTCPYEMCTEGW